MTTDNGMPAQTTPTLEQLTQMMQDGSQQYPSSPERTAITLRLLTLSAMLPTKSLQSMTDVMESVVEARICRKVEREDLINQMPATGRLVQRVWEDMRPLRELHGLVQKASNASRGKG